MAKQLEGQVSMILRQVDQDEFSGKVRASIAILKQALADIRIYTNAYELSETAEEQAQNATNAKKYLGQAQQQILKVSEYNIFGPVDVAHLSAQIEELKDGLK
jgi:hypothetical protein